MCLLLQYILQSCSREGVCVCFFLQYLLQSCSRCCLWKTLKLLQVLDEVGRRLSQLFAGLSGEELEDNIRDAFVQIDANGSGALSQDEFREAFEMICGMCSQKYHAL